jgi:hypothetical protein
LAVKLLEPRHNSGFWYEYDYYRIFDFVFRLILANRLTLTTSLSRLCSITRSWYFSQLLRLILEQTAQGTVGEVIAVRLVWLLPGQIPLWDSIVLTHGLDALALLQATVLAWLTITGTVGVWHILALSVVLGVINAFDMPARHAFVVQMVDSVNSPYYLAHGSTRDAILIGGSDPAGTAKAAETFLAVIKDLPKYVPPKVEA